MKKFACLLLALCMCFALAACSGGDDTAAEGETTSAAKGYNSITKTTTEPIVEKSVKVGFIFLHDENSTYDKNFMTAAEAACKAAGVEYVMKTNIPEDATCYDTACDLADQGCNVIFADSFSHESYLLQAAKEFPDVEFCHATGTMAHTEGLDNFHNAFAHIYQGRFMAGVAAGMKIQDMITKGETVNGIKVTEETAKIGYVGAYTYAEVISGYTSFFLGARSICPSVTMEVQFTGSWYDEALEKEACTKLLNDGCILISQHADSMGAPTACEVAGVPNVSYNGSTQEACPNTYLISSRIDWEPYFTYMIDKASKTNTIATDWCGGVAEKSVVLTDLNTNIAAEGTQAKLDSLASAFRMGTKNVFMTNTYTVDGAKQTTYMADVDTDPDYTPDTEAIKGGFFHESEYRSAPYFDVRIDGITLLNEAF